MKHYKSHLFGFIFAFSNFLAAKADTTGIKSFLCCKLEKSLRIIILLYGQIQAVDSYAPAATHYSPLKFKLQRPLFFMSNTEEW